MSQYRIIIGVSLIMLGFILIMGQFDLIDLDFGDIMSIFWPAALILIGGYFIFRHIRPNKSADLFGDAHIHINTGQKSYSNVAGDRNFETDNIDLDGLTFSTVFGDTKIDLTGGILKPGVNNISLSGVFGDIKVRVPQNMDVLAIGSNTFGDLNILGSTAEGISNRIKKQSDGYDNAESKIKITANTTFGDIKINW